MSELALTTERTLVLLPRVARRLMDMIAVLPVPAPLLKVENAN